MKINYDNINEFCNDYDIPRELINSSLALKFQNLLQIDKIEALTFDIFANGVTDIKNIYTDFHLENENMDVKDFIRIQLINPENILPNKVISRDTDSYIQQDLITPTEGIRLSFGSGIFLSFDKTTDFHRQLDPDIKYNVYLYHSNSLYENPIEDNNNILACTGFNINDFSHTFSKLYNTDYYMASLSEQYLATNTPNLINAVESIFLRDTAVSLKIGNYEKINFNTNDKVLQISKDFDVSQTLSVLNFNVSNYNNQNENILRFDTIIFVPIRNEVIEGSLKEIIFKNLLKKKLEQKLLGG